LTRAHIGTLPILTLTAAMTFGAAAMAADLPKEGTFSGITANTGTYKSGHFGKPPNHDATLTAARIQPTAYEIVNELLSGSRSPRTSGDA
jgi:hypothetical protein